MIVDGGLSSKSTPDITQLYQNENVRNTTKSYPSKKGGFVDLGTHLYELELELSKKNNEIAVLKKKQQKFVEEMYPDGEVKQKSHLNVLRDKCIMTEKKLILKSEQLEWEKEKNKKLNKELGTFKKKVTRLKNRPQHKSVQTVQLKNRSIQVQISSEPKTRNIMTQCTPVMALDMTSAPATPASRNNSSLNVLRNIMNHEESRENYERRSTPTPPKKRSPPQSYTHIMDSINPSAATSAIRSTPHADTETAESGRKVVEFVNVPQTKKEESGTSSKKPSEYATAVHVKAPASLRKDEDLEMSFIQKFSDGNVQTIVQSNQKFNVTERSVKVDKDTFNQVTSVPSSLPLPPPQLSEPERAVSAPLIRTQTPEAHQLATNATPDRLYPTHHHDKHNNLSSSESSGVFSGASSRNPSPVHNMNRQYYTQVSNTPLAMSPTRPETPKRVFERSLPYYMNTAEDQQHPNGSGPFSNEYKDPFREVRQHLASRHNTSRPPSTPSPLPYYLFRRSSTDPNQIKVNKKPLYIHTSEITLF